VTKPSAVNVAKDKPVQPSADKAHKPKDNAVSAAAKRVERQNNAAVKPANAADAACRRSCLP